MTLREYYDLLVVGGGINGAGIARDAAGRGYSVLLCEKDDLAAHTSSASTKLIHGGLRYLEYRDFGLVRKALKEREVLLAAAPHIMWPMRFVMPHDAHLRPAWMIRAGLFLYDHLARRRYLPGSAAIDLRSHVAGEALESRYRRGFVYSDGWVDDARLVVLNALDAAERGATVLTRTRCVQILRADRYWTATLQCASTRTIQARAVVNATGPWVADFCRDAARLRPAREVRLVKGSHIVVPRLFAHRYAYIFQNEDKRVLFAIPYEQDFTLIGTTDVDYSGDPGAARIDAAEVQYLCAMVSRYFRHKLAPEVVLWSYSGVRPLLDDRSADAASVTRDYALDLDANGPPLLSILGGKITTYRRLAEEAMAKLSPLLDRTKQPGGHGIESGTRAREQAMPATNAWTARARLPGGTMPNGSFAAFLRAIDKRYPWLPPALRMRLAHAYGNRVRRLLGDADSLQAMGEEVLPGLYEREIEYLCRIEWARTAEDILWRRTKLGLHLPPASTQRLECWLAQHRKISA